MIANLTPQQVRFLVNTLERVVSEESCRYRDHLCECRQCQAWRILCAIDPASRAVEEAIKAEKSA